MLKLNIDRYPRFPHNLMGGEAFYKKRDVYVFYPEILNNEKYRQNEENKQTFDLNFDGKS